MSYIVTIEELSLDVETLYEDLSEFNTRESIMDFIKENIYSYTSHSYNGCEVVSYERDGETFHENQDVIDEMCEGKIVEVVSNKNPKWIGEDLHDFECSRINNWIECDWDQLVDDYITWKE